MRLSVLFIILTVAVDSIGVGLMMPVMPECNACLAQRVPRRVTHDAHLA